MPNQNSKALRFIIFLGFVSLFADICYEGARSITGPYMAILGANATIVGIVAGSGELFGYSLRYFSGYISDKTKNYWTLTILGYVTNLLTIPFLSITNHWWTAAGLIVGERTGKSLRGPPRDVMLSYAGHQMGRGASFGLHKFLDQMGALIGPIFVTIIIYYYSSYRLSFALLGIPAAISVIIVLFARKYYPNPENLEGKKNELNPKNLTKNYWIYVAALCLIGMGYADFPLIAYHFQKTGSVPLFWIPLFYGIAMGMDGISALCLGKIFDKVGFGVVVIISALAAFVAPLVFGTNFYWALAGMVLWGVGMGAQESIIKAYVTEIVPVENRGSAYGMLNMLFGIFWFLGSALMGILYDHFFTAMIIFSVVVQLFSLPLFLWIKNQK